MAKWSAAAAAKISAKIAKGGENNGEKAWQLARKKLGYAGA
jgi:hypothetical protein